jgi:hypothetical protein
LKEHNQQIIVEASEAGVNLLRLLDKQHVRIISVETRYDLPVTRKVDNVLPTPSKSDLGIFQIPLI